MQAIKIGSDVFLKGRTRCPVVDCDRRFRFLLTFSQVLVWDMRCSKHMELPFDLPSKGRYLVETLDIEEWA